jgi:hypothetical protein
LAGNLYIKSYFVKELFEVMSLEEETRKRIRWVGVGWGG